MNNKKISGITYLKALLPFLVIACHAKPFGKSSFMIKSIKYVPDIKDIFYNNVLYLAVPIFILISFYLYLNKRKNIKYSSFLLLKQRVKYFICVFIISRIIYLFFNIGNIWIIERGTVRNLYHLLFGGGDTLLYYLEQMIYLLILLEIFYYILEKYNLNKKKWSKIFFLISVLILIFTLFLVPEILKIELLRYFSPIGFIPYIFLSIYIFENKSAFKVQFYFCGLAISMFFMVLEWIVLPNSNYLLNGYPMAIPSYCRLSVIIFSTIIFVCTFKIKKVPKKFIEVLASVSLYVYCVHQLIIKILGSHFQNMLLYLITVVITYSICLLCYKISIFLKAKK